MTCAKDGCTNPIRNVQDWLLRHAKWQCQECCPSEAGRRPRGLSNSVGVETAKIKRTYYDNKVVPMGGFK